MSEFFKRIKEIETACKGMVEERDRIHTHMLDMAIEEGRLKSTIHQTLQYLKRQPCAPNCAAITRDRNGGDCDCGLQSMLDLLKDHTPPPDRTIPINTDWKESDWHNFLKSLGFYQSNDVWVYRDKGYGVKFIGDGKVEIWAI